MKLCGWLLVISCCCAGPASGDEPLQVTSEKNQVVVSRGGKPVARYVFRDQHVLRPYFTALHAPGGSEVTRRHPPREGVDPADHATMHPGLWLAFGDLGGVDFWRNKGRVEHVEFTAAPTAKDNVVRFAVVNHYLDDKRLVCREEASYTLELADRGYLLTWDSRISSDAPLVFGDQEEMGLGVRMATPLCVKGGSGTIASSDGKRNEQQVRGTQPDWCDYSGVLEGQRAGVLLMPHRDNFRKSWLHARDYGLLVANPFGQKALSGGPVSRVEVPAKQTLRLRFGIWFYSLAADQEPDFRAVAEQYLRGSQ
jgi:hypothetical protein